jgi:hypothetical protein
MTALTLITLQEGRLAACSELGPKSWTAGACVLWKECFIGLKTLHCAIDDDLQFLRVLHFSSLGKYSSGFFCAEPGRIAHDFVRGSHLLHFHQERFDHVFLNAVGLPEDSFRVQVEMEMSRLDLTACARLFPSFPGSRLAVRQASIRSSFRKRPLAATVRVDQKEFDLCVPTSIADSRYLQRQTDPGAAS